MIRFILRSLLRAFALLRGTRAAKRAIERDVPHVMYGTGPGAKPFEVE